MSHVLVAFLTFEIVMFSRDLNVLLYKKILPPPTLPMYFDVFIHDICDTGYFLF